MPVTQFNRDRNASFFSKQLEKQAEMRATDDAQTPTVPSHKQSDQLLVAPAGPATAAGLQGTAASFRAGVAAGTAARHVAAAHRLSKGERRTRAGC